MPTEANYVAGLALRWARVDPMEQWVNDAPEGGTTPLAETIGEYLSARRCRRCRRRPPQAQRPRARHR